MSLSKAEVCNRIQVIAQQLRRKFFVWYDCTQGYYCATPWKPQGKPSDTIEP